MLGAIIGDIAGSRFEFDNKKSKDFDLFRADLGCSVTDDSIMTLAVAKAILTAGEDRASLAQCAVSAMQSLGKRYPTAGYGRRFSRWLVQDDPAPYHSLGNGAAMRVSPCAYAARSEEEALELARTVTGVTHDHPEGLRGAEAVTAAIYAARTGASKADIRSLIQTRYYDLSFTLDDIRAEYTFDVTCAGSVPQAIEAFLEAESFEDAIRNAVSIGGDSDTIAAIAGSIAEAFYGIPVMLRAQAILFLDSELLRILTEFEERFPSAVR